MEQTYLTYEDEQIVELGEPEKAPLPISRRSLKGFTLDETTILNGKLTTLRELDDEGLLKAEKTIVWEGKPLFRFRHQLYEAILRDGHRSWVITPDAYEYLTDIFAIEPEED